MVGGDHYKKIALSKLTVFVNFLGVIFESAEWAKLFEKCLMKTMS